MTKSAGSRPAGLQGGRLGPGRGAGATVLLFSAGPHYCCNSHRETDADGTAWYHNTRQRIIDAQLIVDGDEMM